MKFFKVLIVLSQMLSYHHHSIAQNNHPIDIRGTICSIKNVNDYDSLLISYNKIDWFADNDSLITIKKKISKNGSFSFILPNLGKPLKIAMRIYNKNKERVWDDIYYAEPEDNVNIEIFQRQSNDSIIFHGNGSEKFQIISKIQKDYYQNYHNFALFLLDPDSFKDSTELARKIEKLAYILDSYASKKNSQLKSANLSNQMTSIINLEFAQYQSEWTNVLKRLYHANPTQRKLIKTLYLKHENTFRQNVNENLIFCNNYLSDLTSQLAFQIMMKSDTDKIAVEVLFNEINKKYSGIVRDRILGICLVDERMKLDYLPTNPDTLNLILKKSLSILKVDYIRKAINSKIEVLEKTNARKIINASFRTLNNKTVELETLHGKVFLIDTWFKGCFACAEFHRAFHETIFSKLRDNKQFVVLSVNTDVNDKDWSDGISRNIYTSPEYLNVTTGSLGKNHPFIKYYKVVGSPWLMIVDKKGLITYQSSGGDLNEIATTLELALNENESAY